MRLSRDLSLSRFHIPHRVSADLCLHVVTLPVHVCSAASPTISIVAALPSHDCYSSAPSILSLLLLGKTPFNTQ
jgi:hypothetical protein